MEPADSSLNRPGQRSPARGATPIRVRLAPPPIPRPEGTGSPPPLPPRIEAEQARRVAEAKRREAIAGAVRRVANASHTVVSSAAPSLRARQSPPPLRSGSSLLNPEELERFKDLLVFARATVEGYFVGKHRSPRRGSSVEFADYKEYVPGDEVNRIDWRAYGRARRLFVRQYEAETDMVIYLLVDVSASMRYAGENRFSKYLVAARIAAALSYLVIRQGDKASLGLFHEKLSRFLPPGGTRRHLYNMLGELERVQPSSTTGISRVLQESNPLFRKRGRIVILSDFWTDQQKFLDALGPFLHRKFDLLLLQVLDPDELELPSASAARFKDMESSEEVQVELEDIRRDYRRNMRARIDTLAREANNRKVKHAVVSTQDPYLSAIEAYMGFRGVNRPVKG